MKPGIKFKIFETGFLLAIGLAYVAFGAYQEVRRIWDV
jgi:hypothetical protein